MPTNPPALLAELACEFSLALIPVSKLPAIAEELITAGHEAPALTKLLVCCSDYSTDFEKLLPLAFKELNVPIPDKITAAVILAAGTSALIVNRSLSPFDGAMKIWKLLIDRLDDCPEELWSFQSNASVIEDCRSNSGVLSAVTKANSEIVAAAKALLRTANQLPSVTRDIRNPAD